MNKQIHKDLLNKIKKNKFYAIFVTFQSKANKIHLYMLATVEDQTFQFIMIV